MEIQPVLIVSLLFICNIYGLDVDEKANQNIIQCIPTPVLICTENDSNICVDPQILLISSPFHGNLTFQLEPFKGKNYLIEANITDYIFTGKMDGTPNQVSVDTCAHSLKNSTLVICLMINKDSWLIEFNETKECYQIQLSQCSVRGFIPIDTIDELKPENLVVLDQSVDHLFDPKFLMSTPRYVQIGVAIDCTSEKFNSSKNQIVSIFKKSTQMLTQMNIFATLSVIKKLDTLDNCNESRTYSEDIIPLLGKFGEYVKENYDTLGKYHVIVRLTGRCKRCHQLGIAYRYTACNPIIGHAVVRDGSDYIFTAAFAHELLHTFGVIHDNEKGLEKEVFCPHEHCLMNAIAPNSEKEIGLSLFTIQQVGTSILLGYLDCFSNKPRLGTYCGDYSLNDQEQCDCLDVKNCANCCNSSTCELLKGAKCGHGPCCNFETCELYKSTDDHVCRPATSDCDIEEKCDGSSQFCPPDLHLHDGWSCDYGQGHCFNGKCGSYHLSCDKIFENSEPGPDSCYENNTLGSIFHNCGPPSKYFKTFSGKAKKCKKKDVKCGRLKCTDGSRLRSSIKYAYMDIMIDFRNWGCRGVFIPRTLKPNATDIGLAPNGAPCAPNKMCLDQECIPVSKVIKTKPCPLNCQNRGMCTNQGTCICNNPKDKSPDCSFSPVTSPNWQALFRYFETTIQLIVMVVVTSTWIWVQLKK